MTSRVGHKLPWAVQKVLHKVYLIIAPILNLDSILVVLKPKEISSFPEEWLCSLPLEKRELSFLIWSLIIRSFILPRAIFLILVKLLEGYHFLYPVIESSLLIWKYFTNNV